MMVSDNKLVVVTGTPGTGKSTISEKLCKKLGWSHIDWHEIFKRNKNVSLGYNRAKKCYDLDMEVLAKEISQILKKNPEQQFVFDSHVAHLLPTKMIGLVIVMKCSNISKLRDRLEKRDYSKKKIEENIQCEIFDVCFDEVVEAGLDYVVFDSGKRLVWKQVFEEVESVL